VATRIQRIGRIGLRAALDERHELIRRTENDVLASCFQIIVDDLVRPGAVDLKNGLRLWRAPRFDAINTGVSDRRTIRVQRNAILNLLRQLATDVAVAGVRTIEPAVPNQALLDR